MSQASVKCKPPNGYPNTTGHIIIGSSVIIKGLVFCMYLIIKWQYGTQNNDSVVANSALGYITKKILTAG